MLLKICLRVKAINDFLFNELKFIYVQTGNLEDLYLNSVIDEMKRKGNCVGMSILYLAISERLHLPIFGVNVPEHIFVRFDNGKTNINIETGEIEKAIQDFDKAIMIRPDLAGLYVDRGILLFQIGGYDEAIIDFDKSLELLPGNQIAFRFRGKSF